MTSSIATTSNFLVFWSRTLALFTLRSRFFIIPALLLILATRVSPIMVKVGSRPISDSFFLLPLLYLPPDGRRLDRVWVITILPTANTIHLKSFLMEWKVAPLDLGKLSFATIGCWIELRFRALCPDPLQVGGTSCDDGRPIVAFEFHSGINKDWALYYISDKINLYKEPVLLKCIIRRVEKWVNLGLLFLV